MQIDEAIKLISVLERKQEIEKVQLLNAANRVLAADVFASDDAPRFSNSAMDGYAVCDLSCEQWRCVDTVFAGDFRQVELNSGECAKIMTGALLPKNTQAVLMVENSQANGEFIRNTGDLLKAGEAMRMQGEEYKKGSLLLQKGEILDAAKIMLAAANGYYELEVFKQSRIGIFASGDELLEPYEKGVGVYNSNAYAIAALASKFANVSYLGVLADNEHKVARAICGAAGSFDLLISIGAASMGDADYIKKALLANGFKELFNKLDLKPGGPVGLFAKDQQLVLTLPGNPMSAYSCMQLLSPAFKKAFYGTNLPNPMQAKLASTVKINNKKENLIYGCVKNEEFIPHNGGKFSSGQISPLVASTHFVRLRANNCAGDIVDIYPL